MSEPLAIPCAFETFRTTVDGGVKFTFATGEESTQAVAKLVSLKNERLYIVVLTEAQYEGGELGNAEEAE